jgi:hypothetical protein
MASAIIASNSGLSPLSTSRHIQCAAARWITTFSPGDIADASVGDLIQGLKELQYFVECYVTETWGFQPLLARLKSKLPTANAVLAQPLEPYYQALDEIKALIKRLRPDALEMDGDVRIFNSKAYIGDLIQRLKALRYFIECNVTETWSFYPLLTSLKSELPIAYTVLTQPLDPYCHAVVEISALQRQLRANT